MLSVVIIPLNVLGQPSMYHDTCERSSQLCPEGPTLLIVGVYDLTMLLKTTFLCFRFKLTRELTLNVGSLHAVFLNCSITSIVAD